VKNKLIQPEVNIGIVGHVDHGKTTLVSRLSGKWTDTHSEEIKRGITIRLGYANTSFYYCEKCKKHTTKETCECGSKTEYIRTISFVDAPGHETLMATMLSGAAIMDGALLLIASNEKCPQPQTKEHLMALEIIGVKNIIIIQNKIDLLSEEDALKNYHDIKNFVKGSIAENVPIIPISAQHNVNIDVLIEAIEKYIPTPKRDQEKEPIMFITRSFDINKPGTEVQKLNGGVLGGALKEGILKVGDEIEIKPGHKIEKDGTIKFESIKTKIIGLRTGESTIKEVTPGGSIAILTELDPSYVKADKLTGNIVGSLNKLPPLWSDLELKPHLLKSAIGTQEELLVEPIKKGEILMLNVNSSVTVGTVYELKKDIVKLKLKIAVCAAKTDRITISRRFGTRWRLIGWGELK